ncbi:MAG TPA: family 16 glycosylhydrolase [Kineosporiaceae bacterium]|nr:family 16 glycosylhydrolase [Kineosporiaceae bacterium]
MIHGSASGPARPVRVAVLVVLSVLLGTAAAVGCASSATAADGAWRTVWSWDASSAGLPSGCSALAGTDASGRRWEPGLVSATGLGLRIAASPRTQGTAAAGSGVTCEGHAARSGRLEVRARVPRASGLVARVAFRPGSDLGTDWSGITVPTWSSCPAYVTNGTGDRVDGASTGRALAGRFHTYTVTWTPASTSMAVDGHEVYEADASYDGPRWPVVGLAPTTATSTTTTYLLVDAITLSAPPPAPAVQQQQVAGVVPPGDHPTGTWTTAPAGGIAGASSVLVAPAPTTPDRSAVGAQGAPAAGPTSDGPLALVGSLDAHRLGTPWLVGGAAVALAVLAGVLRAALVARRRPAAG